MHAKLFCFSHLLIALVVGFTVATAAQAQAPARPAAAATIRGHIADPTGALIPGAKITVVTTAAGAQSATVTADSGGAYVVTGLAPGSYIVKAAFEGFAPAAPGYSSTRRAIPRGAACAALQGD